MGLGYMYDRGAGVPQDYSEALRWYHSAAEQGDVQAQTYLGYAYGRGRGVPQNDADAARWYRKAAEQGDAAAQWYLGRAYYRGQGVPRDYFEAVRWYLKPARQIALRCMRRLGWTSLVAILVAVAILVVPQRRWGRVRWVSWALLSGACAAQVTHYVSGTVWSGRARVLFICLFATLSVVCALTAAILAVSGRKRSRLPIG
jgi:hypothetical protein